AFSKRWCASDDPFPRSAVSAVCGRRRRCSDPDSGVAAWGVYAPPYGLCSAPAVDVSSATRAEILVAKTLFCTERKHETNHAEDLEHGHHVVEVERLRHSRQPRASGSVVAHRTPWCAASQAR